MRRGTSAPGVSAPRPRGTRNLQQVPDGARALQLVREVLAVLEVENAARVELHNCTWRPRDLRGVEDHVHVPS